jgi:hypothetical protein
MAELEPELDLELELELELDRVFFSLTTTGFIINSAFALAAIVFNVPLLLLLLLPLMLSLLSLLYLLLLAGELSEGASSTSES